MSIVLAPSTDLIGYRGSIVTATAYVIGRPLATVQWYTPDGSLITSSQSGGISITQTVLNSSTISSELTISGLTKAHAGLYRCYGYNILLDSSRAEFEVTLNLTVRECKLYHDVLSMVLYVCIFFILFVNVLLYRP